MGREVLETITSIVTAIVGVAIFSVLLGRNSQTTSVIGAAANGLATDLAAATAPVTGNTFSSGLTSSALSGSVSYV